MVYCTFKMSNSNISQDLTPELKNTNSKIQEEKLI